RLGDKGRLLMQGDRATLTLTGVQADALRAWLSEARSAAHARAVDVQLSRSAQGYSGTVVVSLGGTS
ncbi:MAG TPA: type II secretion system protein M, partial [Albitalea sp.]|nr:type II secretion system protein M [Albitalea sp.]